MELIILHKHLHSLSQHPPYSDKNKQNVYNIKSNLNCNSKMVVYLVSCKTCNMQYVGSTSTKFRLCFNNYRSGNRKYNSNETVTQESFFAHFNSSGHNGTKDWNFALIDQSETVDSLRRRESFWQHRLDSFVPNGLNGREVFLDFG